MDPIPSYSNIIGPFSSEDNSSWESLSSGRSGIPEHRNSFSQASSMTEYDIRDDESINRLTYYLNLLRPQSPTSSAKIPADTLTEDAQSNGQSPSNGLQIHRHSPIYITPHAPDNMTIDPIDSNYLQFFFIQAPMFLLFTQHFPSAPSAVFELASNHAPTLQSILAVSAQHADMVAGRKPTRALIHLSKCLPQIQSALSSGQINEGHIAAVYCLTRLYFARRERITARNHLHGLYLMLEAYQQGYLDGTSSTQHQVPRAPSPFMMFLWRIAIQMDLALGNRGQDLVFPSPAPNQDDFHRTWISRITSPEATEWALAEFALDDLHHHTLHLEKFARKLRSAPFYDSNVDEEMIARSVDKLWDMHRQWKSREIVRKAARKETLYRQKFPVKDNSGQFLHYAPPLRFQNEFFVRMLLYHTERIIQIDRILSPTLETLSDRRIRAAIELCRIIAGVDDMMADKGGIGQYFQGLNNAGIVFDPHKYPNEFNWVVDKLVEVDRLSGYDSGRTLVGILRETWNSEDPWMTYWRLSGRSVPS